jgi:alpha-tubulin suppressor-like RCC1 family protein
MAGTLIMESGETRNEAPKRAPAIVEGPRIVAAGLNAHNQIQENGGKDIHSFIPIIDGNQESGAVRILFTGWSSIVLVQDTKVFGTGFQRFSQTLALQVAETLIDGFGDHNGMIGCLDTAGNLYLVSDSGELVNQSTDSSPKLGHIANAGNGKFALSFKQAPNGRLCHILQFETFDEFRIWFHNPSGVQIEPEKQHFMMQGRPIQLVANTGTFMVLMEGGEVYTWGDPRYQSLGRKIADTPAHRPGMLEALGGLKIVKVAVGGWMGAALAEDRAAYVWGAGEPGKDQILKLLREADAGEVVLISIPSTKDGAAEPLDIIDIGMGDNHIAVIAEGGRLFVAGDNKNGQLGPDRDEPWVDDWVEVPNVDSSNNIGGVVCGPKTTFVSSKT